MDRRNGRLDQIRRRDIFFILAVFAAAVIFFAVVHYRGKESGSHVVITVDGEIYGTYSLETEQDIPIIIDGQETNHVQIANGYADMTEASCPDLLCVHQRKISKVKETIVCLPNKVVLEVIDGEETGIDAVAE